MWTQTRIAPSSSRSAEIASSKSRAVGGSIVKVGRSRRSRRGPASACGGRSAASRASRSTAGSKRRAQPAVEHQRLEHVARGRPGARAAARPCRARRAGRSARTSTRSPGAHLARGLSRLMRRPRAKNGVAGEEPAALLEHGDDRVGALTRARAPRLRTATSSASSRFVLPLSCAFTSGVMPAPRFDPPPPRLRRWA